MLESFGASQDVQLVQVRIAALKLFNSPVISTRPKKTLAAIVKSCNPRVNKIHLAFWLQLQGTNILES